MKKLIITLLFLLLSYSVSLAENQQLAWMGPVIAGCGTGTVSGGGECTLLESCTGTDDNTGLAGNNYVGQDAYTVASKNMCQLDVYVKTKPSSGNCVAYVYSSDGATNLCTSDSLAYSAMSDESWSSFVFSSDCNLNGTYKVLVACDASWTIYDSTAGSIAGTFTTCASSPETCDLYNGYDASFRYYFK